MDIIDPNRYYEKKMTINTSHRYTNQISKVTIECKFLMYNCAVARKDKVQILFE
jgi:hypothetical protein